MLPTRNRCTDGTMAHPMLLVYSTTDGHLNVFERIVIGASIRYGEHQPQVAAFIAQHQAVLERKPNVFFIINSVARKSKKINVSIRARHCWRAILAPPHTVTSPGLFQSAPAIAGGRF